MIRASDPMDTQSGFRFSPVESGCSRFCVVMVGVPEAVGKESLGANGRPLRLLD